MRTNQTYEKIIQFIHKYHMITAGDHVCVGFSGGADSLFLLLFLWERRRRLKITVSACHVNHQMRGGASDGDEAFAEKFCREKGIPFYCFRYPVKELAESWGMGTEEAGRRVRRNVFRICMEKYGVTKTALAHHLNDQAETVLFHMARGSSLAGVSGIKPVSSISVNNSSISWPDAGKINDKEAQGGKESPAAEKDMIRRKNMDHAEAGTIKAAVIHPLLCVSRGEIEESLRERGISWRTDHTNLENDFSRNKIRNKVLSYMEKEINEAVSANIARTAEFAGKADDFLREEAKRRSIKYVQSKLKDTEAAGTFISGDILEEPEIMQEYILMECLAGTAGSRKDISSVHVDLIRDLLQMDAGKTLDLPYMTKAVKTCGGIIIAPESFFAEKKELRNKEKEFRKPVPVVIEDDGCVCKWDNYILNAHISGQIPAEIPENKYTKWLDYDKIKNGLVVRTRQSGDYFTLDEAGHRKKLKEFFIEHKIPKEKRDDIWLLASGSKVFWIIGHRISYDAKITEKTRNVIRISFSGEKGNE